MNIIHSLQEGDTITDFFLIKDVQRKTSSRGTDFLDFQLADRTGQIGAKLWDCTDLDAETFVSSSIVKLQGVVKKYNNQVYIEIQRIRLANGEDHVGVEDLVRSAPMNPHEMMAELRGFIELMTDPEVKAIVEHVVGRNEEKLMTFPAGMKIHHDFYGGLLYHLISMLRLAQFIVGEYPILRYDLLAAGVILHDIAKTEELDAENGVVNDYTVNGKLLGHIVQGILMVENAARELGIESETVTLLQHLIASHHEKKEYGSPVEPQLPEAVALCNIDLLDSRMNAIQKAIDQAKHGEVFTEPVRAANNKRIYMGNR